MPWEAAWRVVFSRLWRVCLRVCRVRDWETASLSFWGMVRVDLELFAGCIQTMTDTAVLLVLIQWREVQKQNVRSAVVRVDRCTPLREFDDIAYTSPSSFPFRKTNLHRSWEAAFALETTRPQLEVC